MVATKVEHVVVDAGAFLKNVLLHEIGQNIYTLKDVVNEIHDKQTKRNLSFLPYKLNFKEPFPEHVRFVTEFSKKTGDYASLSATDIRVLALTYQLELENCGADHLKIEPAIEVEVCSTRRHPEAPVNIVGFHLSSKGGGVSLKSNLRKQKWNYLQKESSNRHGVQTPVASPKPQVSESSEFNSFQFWRVPVPRIHEELLKLVSDEYVTEKLQAVELSADTEKPAFKNGLREDENEENCIEEEVDEDEEEDGGGWITPNNIKQVQMHAGSWRPSEIVKVGCMTTDFAMQNVLIQIGLNVLSVNGMLIKYTRSYILRCHACFKTTRNMSKSFCPNCGNNTLKKVAVTLGEDGNMQMHFSSNPKVLNPKGKRYSLLAPQGGKHSNNPHLVEDQRFPQQRLSRKARQKTDVFNPDYLADSSPFSVHDVYSRASNLHLRDAQCGGGKRRANPNASCKKFVKKK